MTRGGHRIKPNGYCRRCALYPGANYGQCPPGFWMTEAELTAWRASSPDDRREMELRLGARFASEESRYGT